VGRHVVPVVSMTGWVIVIALHTGGGVQSPERCTHPPTKCPNSTIQLNSVPMYPTPSSLYDPSGACLLLRVQNPVPMCPPPPMYYDNPCHDQWIEVPLVRLSR
jgi:hypothetical protein